MKTKPPQPSIPPSTIEMSLMLDMEAVRYRMDENVFVNMSQYNITSSTRMSIIFEASTNRFTMFTDQEMTGPSPSSKKNCTLGSFPTLNEPAVVGKCIQDALANSKPVGSEGGLEKYEMHMPVPGSQTDAGTEAFYLDKDNVLKKLTVDMTVAGMTEHMVLTDLDAKAGTPDASLFTQPAEWGKCTEMPVPPPPAGMPPSFQAFMKCAGITPSPPPLLAPGLKLVSQTFNGIGKMTMKTEPPQPSIPPSTIEMSLMLDMEAVRYRMDENVFMIMSQYNTTSSTRMSIIFEASTKRFTMFMDQEMTGPAPKSTKTCTFGSFPTLHEAIRETILCVAHFV